MKIQNNGKYNLICSECQEPFFTDEEKVYYVKHNYLFPDRCRNCKQSILNISKEKLYNEILSNWSVEARKERSEYFYNVGEVQDVLNGNKTFVIGRKGSGKTSIAQHLYDMEKANIFCQKMSFKNFPFKILYSLDNQNQYTEPNQYISIWKYLIFTCVCKKMLLNYNIDNTIREKLGKLYGDSTIDSLDKLIGKWTSKEFGFQILGSGLNYSSERRESSISWIDSIEILERIIIDYCDDAQYYIIFDELDEDYKDFINIEEANKYKCMLTSLFKAVQDIRSLFDYYGKNIYPVVFLRSDIYAQIKDSDKNKWRESIIDMVWDTNKIKHMLAHRLSVAMDIPDDSFDIIWHKVFKENHVRMGNKKGRRMPIYDYIERSTEMRPRDFVQYVKECVQLSKERCENRISSKTVKDADENFSEYLKAETIDELFSVIPEIDEILGLLSTIRKQRFHFSTFEKEYESLVNQGKIIKRDVKWVLLKLFEAGVIGNQPPMKGQAIFSFSKRAPRFNFNEPMLIHRGLFKALQIY